MKTYIVLCIFLIVIISVRHFKELSMMIDSNNYAKTNIQNTLMCVPGGFYINNNENHSQFYSYKNNLLDLIQNKYIAYELLNTDIKKFMDMMKISKSRKTKLLCDIWPIIEQYYEEYVNILDKQKHVITCIVREYFVELFSWSAIPSRTYIDISNLLKENGVTTIIDPFAGTGFMGFRFSLENFNVILSDARPGNIQWLPIQKINVEDYEFDNLQETHIALLLSWVDLWSNSGTTILNKFKGQYLIWVGEGKGGCCGDDTIHQIMEQDWKILKHFDYQKFPGLNDFARVYKRK